MRKFLLTVIAVAVSVAAYADTYIRHEVKKGETLFGIAHKYNIPYKQIEALNPQAATGVKKGMILLIPDGTADEPQAQQPAGTAVEPQAQQPDPDTEQTQPQAIVSIPEIYYAESGDTFVSIASRFGMTVDGLMDLNPFLDPNSLRPGSAVRLKEQAPLVNTRPAANEPIDEPQNPPSQPSSDNNDDGQYPTASDLEVVSTNIINDLLDDLRDSDVNAEIEQIDNEPMTILIALPFMADGETQDKAAQRYSEFYRGFLMGAYELSQVSGTPIDVVAQDTQGNMETLRTQLHNNMSRNPRAVIIPEEESALRAALEAGQEDGPIVLNLFNVRDSSYLSHPRMAQANISQSRMYDKAINFFLSHYRGFTPVFLVSAGRTEKMPFVESLRARCASEGLPTLTINFDTYLRHSDLDILNDADRYVFVPASGAMSEFNKFASTLADIKSRPGNADRLAVFGYPDWTAFRSESRTRLHDLEATIYSRFFCDDTDDAYRRIEDQYFDWYGTEMSESVPMQAILGYDTAIMLIKALRSGLPLDRVMQSGASFRGLQSTFQFVPEGEGYVNNALYIIQFLPSRITDVRIL